MEIIVGKQSGFCFGVKNVVEKANVELDKCNNETLYCLGELVHNKNVVSRLEQKGLKVVDNLNKVKDRAIIRAHGVEKHIYEDAKKLNIELIDLTCPKVLAIHKIVEKYEQEGYYIVLICNKVHPEAKGTYSFANKENICMVETEEDIDLAIPSIESSKKNKVLIIAQTTFNLKKFDNYSYTIKQRIEERCEVIIKNTICKSTEFRQNETEEIAKKVDIMLIIGGKNSSNTTKLFEISSKYCKKSFFIENIQETPIKEIIENEKIGVVAGASTPQEDIYELVNKLKGGI